MDVLWLIHRKPRYIFSCGISVASAHNIMRYIITFLMSKVKRIHTVWLLLNKSTHGDTATQLKVIVNHSGGGYFTTITFSMYVISIITQLLSKDTTFWFKILISNVLYYLKITVLLLFRRIEKVSYDNYVYIIRAIIITIIIHGSGLLFRVPWLNIWYSTKLCCNLWNWAQKPTFHSSSLKTLRPMVLLSVAANEGLGYYLRRQGVAKIIYLSTKPWVSS